MRSSRTDDEPRMLWLEVWGGPSLSLLVIHINCPVDPNDCSNDHDIHCEIARGVIVEYDRRPGH